MRYIYKLLSAGMLLTTSVSGQTDSISTFHPEPSTVEILERIAEDTEGEIDYVDLTEILEERARNPLNINIASREELQSLGLLSEYQVRSLYDYVRIYGQLLSVNELLAVDNFDEATIRKISPYICIKPAAPEKKLKLHQLLKYSRHDLIFRVQTIGEKEKGYENVTDSMFLLKPGNYYSGSPQKLYTRYRMQAGNNIMAGLVCEKDAGEVFLRSRISDSIMQAAGVRIQKGFDHYSGFLNLRDIGIIENLTLGDYHLQFGQGLVLWSNMSMGKSGSVAGIMRSARGIVPASSSDENRFFRGLALTLKGPFNTRSTFFYSDKLYDANLVTTADSLDSDEFTIATSLQESGLHRTLAELQDKHNLRIRLGGTNISFRGERLKMGMTAYFTHYDHEILKNNELYKKYSFSGDRLNHAGLDFSYLFKNLVLFGEFAKSQPGDLAGLAGLSAKPSDILEFSMLYRNYNRNYHSFLSNAFGENTGTSNEKGWYAGLSFSPLPDISLYTYLDQYAFPWLKFRVNSPSSGTEYYIRMNYSLSKTAELLLSYRYKSREENFSGENPMHSIIRTAIKHNYRAQFNWRPHEHWEFQNRFDYVRNYNEGAAAFTGGCLMAQDVAWNTGKNIVIHLRYALFNTDSYIDRIYSYEHDVLYSFSIPAYYYNGTRTYLLLKYRITKHLDAWFRVSRTAYYDRDSNGSSTAEVPRNHRTSFSLQVRIHF